ncbi:MAG: type II toxin-antitoxin system RelE/ParE family toxin [Chloroflexi bacterium]|nr:type II toxin-antitoxin system RelE/ParE family toxin [Chloroflexota bacterium]
MPTELAERVRHRLTELREDPRGRGTKQLVGRPTRWRTRVGDLRIIYAITDPDEETVIEAVGNRDDIYKVLRRR